MGLRDLMNETLASFDPKKDNPNSGGFENLPDGDYDVVLNKVEHKTFQSGWECLSFENEVIMGEAAGRKEFVNLAFSDGTLDFLLKKNIKLVAKLASVTGTQLMDDDWEDETTLAEAFQVAVGSQYILNITSSPNKKKPDEPYRNFDFEEYDDEDGQAIDEPIDVSDDELPFV